MHSWYVVQVISGQEKKVKRALEEFRDVKGVTDWVKDILVPSEMVSEVKKGEQKISEKRMWPGYVFVKMTLNDDSWSYVKATIGVIDFLGGEHPTSLTEKEVEQILSDIAAKEKGIVQKHKFEVGDKVKITDGVFVNFIGTITDIFHDKGRLSVMVSIFGRDTQVDDLEFWQVEQVTNEEED